MACGAAALLAIPVLAGSALTATGVRAQDFTTGLHAYEAGDYATAFGNWWPLALKGNAKAQASLGLLYYSGKGAPRDYAKALLWFSRAAEAGQPTAQFFMGVLYYYGKGVPRNLGLAHAWCDIAVTYGYLDSLYCRDAIEPEMSEADKKISEKFTTRFNLTHKFKN
ncbi:MAG: sel1 repeat family protein [Hyphomicrobiales bacterium]|nr:sel1 repeat family protein [Hyphomicrobiales bacterium]